MPKVPVKANKAQLAISAVKPYAISFDHFRRMSVDLDPIMLLPLARTNDAKKQAVTISRSNTIGTHASVALTFFAAPLRRHLTSWCSVFMLSKC